MLALRKRLPPLRDILSLYGSIVFLIYAWAMVAFFWKLPSWLYFLTLGDIVSIFSYTLASSLVESTIILFLFLLAGVILPSGWLSKRFVVRGSVIFYVVSFWVILLHLNSLLQLPTTSDILSFGALTFATVTLSITIASRVAKIEKALMRAGNLLTIFLYFWIPLSIVGIIVVLLRIS